MFLFYNHLVDKRQNVVMDQANRTTAIVSSLFPESVTKRLIAEHKGSNEKNNDADNNDKFQSANRRIQSFLKSAGDETADSNQARVEQKPIADLLSTSKEAANPVLEPTNLLLILIATLVAMMTCFPQPPL